MKLIFMVVIALALFVASGAEAIDESLKSTFRGDGQLQSYEAIEISGTTTTSQLSGTGTVLIIRNTEWNETGSKMEVIGEIEPRNPSAWSNRYIGGAATQDIGAHRLEMRSLGHLSIASTMMAGTATGLDSAHSFDASEVYFENIIESLNPGATHLSDRSRMYFEGENATGRFEFVAGPRSDLPDVDWLPCV